MILALKADDLITKDDIHNEDDEELHDYAGESVIAIGVAVGAATGIKIFSKSDQLPKIDDSCVKQHDKELVINFEDKKQVIDFENVDKKPVIDFENVDKRILATICKQESELSTTVGSPNPLHSPENIAKGIISDDNIEAVKVQLFKDSDISKTKSRSPRMQKISNVKFSKNKSSLPLAPTLQIYTSISDESSKENSTSQNNQVIEKRLSETQNLTTVNENTKAGIDISNTEYTIIEESEIETEPNQPLESMTLKNQTDINEGVQVISSPKFVDVEIKRDYSDNLPLNTNDNFETSSRINSTDNITGPMEFDDGRQLKRELVSHYDKINEILTNVAIYSDDGNEELANNICDVLDELYDPNGYICQEQLNQITNKGNFWNMFTNMFNNINDHIKDILNTIVKNQDCISVVPEKLKHSIKALRKLSREVRSTKNIDEDYQSRIKQEVENIVDTLQIYKHVSPHCMIETFMSTTKSDNSYIAIDALVSYILKDDKKQPEIFDSYINELEPSFQELRAAPVKYMRSSYVDTEESRQESDSQKITKPNANEEHNSNFMHESSHRNNITYINTAIPQRGAPVKPMKNILQTSTHTELRDNIAKYRSTQQLVDYTDETRGIPYSQYLKERLNQKVVPQQSSHSPYTQDIGKVDQRSNIPMIPVNRMRTTSTNSSMPPYQPPTYNINHFYSNFQGPKQVARPVKNPSLQPLDFSKGNSPASIPRTDLPTVYRPVSTHLLPKSNSTPTLPAQPALHPIVIHSRPQSKDRTEARINAIKYRTNNYTPTDSQQFHLNK